MGEVNISNRGWGISPLDSTFHGALVFYCDSGKYRIYSRNSRHRVIHAFNTILKKLPV